MAHQSHTSTLPTQYSIEVIKSSVHMMGTATYHTQEGQSSQHTSGETNRTDNHLHHNLASGQTRLVGKCRTMQLHLKLKLN